MATSKTTSTKRKTTTTKKAAPKKKTTAKRAPAKTTTKARRKTAATTSKQSFKLQRSDEPFISLKVTIQTLYWLILAGAVLLLGIWVLDISQKVQSIYDEIDSNMVIQSELDERELEMLRERANQQ